MSALNWPILRTRLAWVTVWRLYIWLACGCRRVGVWSSTGGRCDACNRRELIEHTEEEKR